MSEALRTVSPVGSARPWAAAASARDDLGALDRLGMVLSVRRDAVLFHEGDGAEHCFKVVSGAVRSSKLLADGRRHVSEFCLPGDFIGFDGAASYQFTAEAISDTTVIRYARRRVDTLAWQQPQIGRQLLDIVCRGFSSAQQKLVLLARKTAEERIASFLVDLAKRMGGSDRISLPMSRTDIGDHLGLTMETVSRGFSHLKAKGLIDLESSHEVVIRDRSALEELAEVL